MYNTRNLPNAKTTPTGTQYDKTVQNVEISNLQRFQNVNFGYQGFDLATVDGTSTSFVRLSNNYATFGNSSYPWQTPAGGPYTLTLDQQCNPEMFIEPDTVNTGAYDVEGVFIEANKRVFWIWQPYGLNYLHGRADLDVPL